VSKNLFSVDPSGKVQLHLHAGQWRTWQADARFIFMLAGSQGGKTSFGPWWLHREIVRRGSGDYLAVAPTWDLFDLKMLPEMLNVFVRVLGIGRLWPGIGTIELCDPVTRQFYANRKDDPMWGRIIMRSASSEGSLESATAKAAWLDEAGQDTFTVNVWEAILRRLSLAEGRVLGTTTLYNEGWLKQIVYNSWLAGDPDYQVVQFASAQNPLFPRKEFLRAKRTMPYWKFAMFYLGEFAKPPGLIYGDYDEQMHMVRPFVIPPHWPRMVGLDPGGVNMATIWMAEDPNAHVYYVYRETLEGNMTTTEHVARNIERAEGENVVLWVGGAPSEGQVRRDWNDAGILVYQPPISEVEAGIDRVITLFKQKRIRIFESCTGLRDELGKYSRALDKNGEVTTEIKDKSRYHRLDSLRYVVTMANTAVDFADVDLKVNAPNMWSAIQR